MARDDKNFKIFQREAIAREIYRCLINLIAYKEIQSKQSYLEILESHNTQFLFTRNELEYFKQYSDKSESNNLLKRISWHTLSSNLFICGLLKDTEFKMYNTIVKDIPENLLEECLKILNGKVSNLEMNFKKETELFLQFFIMEKLISNRILDETYIKISKELVDEEAQSVRNESLQKALAFLTEQSEILEIPNLKDSVDVNSLKYFDKKISELEGEELLTAYSSTQSMSINITKWAQIVLSPVYEEIYYQGSRIKIVVFVREQTKEKDVMLHISKMKKKIQNKKIEEAKSMAVSNIMKMFDEYKVSHPDSQLSTEELNDKIKPFKIAGKLNEPEHIMYSFDCYENELFTGQMPVSFDNQKTSFIGDIGFQI